MCEANICAVRRTQTQTHARRRGDKRMYIYYMRGIRRTFTIRAHVARAPTKAAHTEALHRRRRQRAVEPRATSNYRFVHQ